VDEGKRNYGIKKSQLMQRVRLLISAIGAPLVAQ
jgi:hypothetical protein